MRNYKMIIAYDGSRYKGWQRQNLTNLTIQTILERTVEQIVGYPVEIDGSGRTDAGVHANGQVANMKVSGLLDESFVGELNCLLPEDICVKEMELVPGSFTAATVQRRKSISIVSIHERSRVFLQEDIHIILRRNYIWMI